jgi:putative transposase
VGGKRHTIEEILQKLDRAERARAKGRSMQAVFGDLKVTEQTYYRWRKEYGASRVELAKRVKVLEKENGQLRRMLAEKMLNQTILRGGPSPHS